MAFLAPLIVSGIQMGMEYAINKDLAEREAESQRQVEAYWRKQQEAYDKDQALYVKAREVEAEKRNKLNQENIALLQKGQAKQAEIEKQRKIENEQRKAKELEQKVQENERLAQEQALNKQKLVQQQQSALQQTGAIMGQDLQKMSQLREQQLEQMKQQQQAQLRQQQEVFKRELEQKKRIPRKVPVMKTTIRRGRGVNSRMIEVIMEYYGISKNEAKKIYKDHFQSI